MEHDYRDVLRKAASYVEQGWWQSSKYNGFGHFSNPTADHSYCALTAIGESARQLLGTIDWDEDQTASLIHLSAVDRFQEYIGTSRVTAWNDAEGRTADEVAAALREAADA